MARRRAVSGRPVMPEGIAEATLAMGIPRHLVIVHLGAGRGSFGHRVSHHAVRIVRGQPNARTRGPSLVGAEFCRVGRIHLVQKERGEATSSPATPPRFQSTLAPSAFRYQAIVASASGTMSITEIAVDGGTKMSSAKSGPPVEYSGQCWWGEPP